MSDQDTLRGAHGASGTPVPYHADPNEQIIEADFDMDFRARTRTDGTIEIMLLKYIPTRRNAASRWVAYPLDGGDHLWERVEAAGASAIREQRDLLEGEDV